MTEGRDVALVTGGARGIGFEVARQLARRGMTVILAARDLDKAEAAARELADEGFDVRAGTIDVTDGKSVKALAIEVEREFGKLDALVNNAAVFADWSETASTVDLATSRAVFDTNLFGAWRVCQAFLPLIRRSRHGRIVNVSSGAGSHGEPRFGLTTGGGGLRGLQGRPHREARHGVERDRRSRQLGRPRPDRHLPGDGGDRRPSDP